MAFFCSLAALRFNNCTLKRVLASTRRKRVFSRVSVGSLSAQISPRDDLCFHFVYSPGTFQIIIIDPIFWLLKKNSLTLTSLSSSTQVFYSGLQFGFLPTPQAKPPHSGGLHFLEPRENFQSPTTTSLDIETKIHWYGVKKKGKHLLIYGLFETPFVSVL